MHLLEIRTLHLCEGSGGSSHNKLGILSFPNEFHCPLSKYVSYDKYLKTLKSQIFLNNSLMDINYNNYLAYIFYYSL